MASQTTDTQLEMITAIVKRGSAQRVANAAIDAGAHAATIHFARGIVSGQRRRVFGLHLHTEKEIVFTVVPADLAHDVYDSMVAEGRLHEHGKGFIFMQDVQRATGHVTDTLVVD